MDRDEPKVRDRRPKDGIGCLTRFEPVYERFDLTNSALLQVPPLHDFLSDGVLANDNPHHGAIVTCIRLDIYFWTFRPR
jgi:hypothetical protein